MRTISPLLLLLIIAAPACLCADDFKATASASSGERKPLVVDVPPGYEVAEASRRRVRFVPTDKTVSRRERLRAAADATLTGKPVVAPWAPNAPGG